MTSEAPNLITRNRHLLQAMGVFAAEFESREFEPHDMVILPSKDQATLAWIQSGVVKKLGALNNRVSDGRRSLDFFAQDDLIGLESLHGYFNPNAYICMVQTTAVIFEAREFLSLAPPEVIQLCLLYRLRDGMSSDFIALMAKESTEKRVLARLYVLRERVPGFEIPITVTDIAQMCGTSPTRVSNVLAKLEYQGALSRTYGNIILPPAKVLLNYLLG